MKCALCNKEIMNKKYCSRDCANKERARLKKQGNPEKYVCNAVKACDISGYRNHRLNERYSPNDQKVLV